jgi:hypothetical protein
MTVQTFRTFVLGCLVASTAAQDILKTFSVFSGPDCGGDRSEGSVNLIVFPGRQGDDQDFITHCADERIGLPGWPTTNGKYDIYVNSAPIDDGCQLIFFTPPPEDDDVSNATCFQFYRAINSNSGCARLQIQSHFGYA